MRLRRFEGRRALVTGASRGIGAAVAERLAAEGAHVVLTARTLERSGSLPGSLEETAARLAAHGGRVGVVAADLADPEDRASVVPAAEERLGGHVEILVNNAAAAIFRPLLELSHKRRALMLEVNVHAPLELAAAAVPGMRAAGEGWIVNLVSGAAALRPGPPFEQGAKGTATAFYGASKAALVRLTNGLGAELHGTGIRVNALRPRAAVLTEGAAELMGDRLDPAKVERVEEVVEAVTALCACPEEVTGRDLVSLDLLERWGLSVHGLDGRAP